MMAGVVSSGTQRNLTATFRAFGDSIMPKRAPLHVLNLLGELELRPSSGKSKSTFFVMSIVILRSLGRSKILSRFIDCLPTNQIASTARKTRWTRRCEWCNSSCVKIISLRESMRATSIFLILLLPSWRSSGHC